MAADPRGEHDFREARYERDYRGFRLLVGMATLCVILAVLSLLFYVFS